MKRFTKRISALLMSLVMLASVFAAVPVVVEAVDTPLKLEGKSVEFWADPENRIKADDLTAFSSGDKTSMVGAVGAFARSTSSDNYYLFLPSNADCTALKVWFNASTCSVGGAALTSGEKTDVFSAADDGNMHNYTLSLNGTDYSLGVMKSGDVGTVYIDTNSGSISKITNSSNHTAYEDGTIMVVNADGTIEYDGVLSKMSGRGNGTWGTNNIKNPYNIKLATSTKLLGMPKARKWCLLANAGDGTFVKNQLTYDFADYIGIKYQTHCKPVDLYVNQQYYGSYQLAEKVEIKSNRVNIVDNYSNLEIANGTVDDNDVVTPADMDTLGLSTRTIDANNSTVALQTELSANYFGHTVGSRRYSAYATTSQTGTSYSNINDPDDLTGGYIFELEISERWATENAGFCAYNRQGWTVKSNDYISRHQVDYCYNLLYALGGALYNGGTVPSASVTTNCSELSNTTGVLNNYGPKSITNPAPAEQYRGKKWSDLLDSDSAVRFYWTQEYFKNMDSSTSSTYFYKDIDSNDHKLYAGPLWDMDNSIGYGENSSRWGYSWTSADGWYTKNTRIYRWRTRDNNTKYSSDSYAPLSFYGALATNCTDFWQSAQSEWYRNISPAVDILTSDDDDSDSVLHNVDYYVDTVSKSALMNNYKVNDSQTFDADGIKRDLKTWLTSRQTWINSQFSKVDINNCVIQPIGNQSFCGDASRPKVTVTYNGATLVEGLDYTVSYSSNTSVGVATATVSGKGLYTGVKNIDFNIVKSSLSGTVTLPQAAYADDVIKAEVLNVNGTDISQFVNYQWYSNGVMIDGATDSTYTVRSDDVNKIITVTVSGDSRNLTGSLDSNECTVKPGTKPTNYTETIAAWNYDYSVNPDALTNTDTSGGYSYAATEGQLGEFALLSGSVNASSQSKIKWSDDYYSNDMVTVSPDCSPIIGTSKTDVVAWGEYPYFETAVKTNGYENITFSAKLGGTNKGPSTYKLQYSLDGSDYTDIDGSTYVISNNKTMENAFNDVELPANCSDKSVIYIRVVACDDVAINSKYRIVGITSGDASINNISVKGTRISAITSLEAPTIINSSRNSDGSALFDNDLLTLRDNNGGADVYYSVGGEDKLYTEPFSPFGEDAVAGDSVTVTAYSKFEDVISDIVTATYTFAGRDINHFIYSTYSDNVYSGALYSNGGAYGGSAKMTAYTDGNSQYVPLWNEKNGAFCIAPDDGALWTDHSGYTFELSTAGFSDVTVTAKAYTTGKGPKSLSMQYSLDGGTWYNFGETLDLSANGALEQYLMTYPLPSSCDNRKQVFVRFITSENATHGDSAEPSTTLHNNMSKGNLYINNIIFAGNDADEAKMPYTNKTSDYFGSTGSLKYYSADGKSMFYSVVNSSGTIISSGNYDSETGIQIQNAQLFNPYSGEPYTVSVWTGTGDDRSPVNARKYYYKGDTVCEFNYNSSSRALEYYLDSTGTVASNTGGTAEGTLSMLPNGITTAVLTPDDTYGVKVAWASDNFFTYDFSTPLDTPGGGYWLITTSTLGYHDLSLNLEQLSSNKGPRDWGLAYSTDGSNYTYIADSNVRAISNDATTSTVETYNNFALPTACNNRETLYLKLFLNGGETVDGNELSDMLKGNTGIENITLSGIGEAPSVDFTINTVSLENANGGSYPTDATVTVNGTQFNTENGSVTLSLRSGNTYTATVSSNGTFVNTVSFTAAENGSITVPVVAVDVNGDGFINGRDLAAIKKISDSEKRNAYKRAFAYLIGSENDSFTYEN